MPDKSLAERLHECADNCVTVNTTASANRLELHALADQVGELETATLDHVATRAKAALAIGAIEGIGSVFSGEVLDRCREEVLATINDFALNPEDTDA